ncbi:uncharacterized protein PITG_15827 [Phytophthora infestans T30-4]|uniref:Core-binding (CB) domain-containing protein n=1 Tax=Phytophthora infestans (strain T30-4) TaxID=403677 RepID=D0NRT9_PHYIT|nr:uncharacterized protein PITG_15827 [Phytophthora infestans T30-4]EEY63480.1 conserved hypothetical protein [Phytophthora infestans T30-4]|eukprot:XP_002898067.1 conserved hypothetical protein [Phytophthora infestans T30-4]
MDSHDWEKLEKTVRDIRENTVTARSRATYQNSYCRFLAWIIRNKPHLVPKPFLDGLGDISECTLQQLRSRVKDLVTQRRTVIPLEFEALDAADFVTWLVTLERKDGCALSYSALNTHRAGLFNLFRLKHKLAKDAANGESSVKTGKDPLMFDLRWHLLTRTW